VRTAAAQPDGFPRRRPSTRPALQRRTRLPVQTRRTPGPPRRQAHNHKTIIGSLGRTLTLTSRSCSLSRDILAEASAHNRSARACLSGCPPFGQLRTGCSVSCCGSGLSGHRFLLPGRRYGTLVGRSGATIAHAAVDGHHDRSGPLYLASEAVGDLCQFVLSSIRRLRETNEPGNDPGEWLVCRI